MARPRGFDMEEAIGIAARLFWQGYDRTSLIDLTSTLNVGPASFYFAFGSKEALFRRVVERYLSAREQVFEAVFETGTTRAAVEALLRDYVDVVTDPNHTPGCLVVNSSPAIDADALRQWLAMHREVLRKRLESRFSQAIARGELNAATSAATLARFITTVAGGLAVEASSGATREQLYDAVTLAMKAFPG